MAAGLAAESSVVRARLSSRPPHRWMRRNLIWKHSPGRPNSAVCVWWWWWWPEVLRERSCFNQNSLLNGTGLTTMLKIDRIFPVHGSRLKPDKKTLINPVNPVLI